jgi:hypothetical protein
VRKHLRLIRWDRLDPEAPNPIEDTSSGEPGCGGRPGCERSELWGGRDESRGCDGVDVPPGVHPIDPDPTGHYREASDPSGGAPGIAEPLVSTRISRRGPSRGDFAEELQGDSCLAGRPSSERGPVRPGEVIGAVLPRHVRACQHSDDRSERWFVWTWPLGKDGTQRRVPYSCGSWRCPVCRRHEAAVTFARIREAVHRDRYEPDGWVYMVLTIDRDGYYSGRPWPNVTAAYRALSAMSERFVKRLRRLCGSSLRSWVSVVEAHRSGWPHMNVMLYCPELAASLRESTRSRIDSGCTPRQAILLETEILQHAVACGWGPQSTAEGVKDRDALAGYITKIAGNHDASVGELAKITQAPTAAPGRFRRLRSAKGFLPPRNKNPNVTGVLVRRRRSHEGDWEIYGVNASQDPAMHEPIRRACAGEWKLILEEERLLAQARNGQLPPMPPVRVSVSGELRAFEEETELRWAAERKAWESA